MKNIICFLSGIVAGIAMCLTAAYYLPESSFDDELGHESAGSDHRVRTRCARL